MMKTARKFRILVTLPVLIVLSMLLSPGMTLADDEDATHCDGLLSGQTGPYSQQNLLNADGLEISTRCHFLLQGLIPD